MTEGVMMLKIHLYITGLYYNTLKKQHTTTVFTVFK